MYGGGSFCLAAKVLDDDNMQPSGEIFAIPHQHYQSGYQFTFSSLENNGANLQRNKEFGSTTILRKRSNEDSSSLSERGITSLIENINEQEKNKRRKAASSLQQWHHQVQETSNFQVQKVPIRRSQKLSDKITALQKLVSPYGKTDTASVLQEASLYIKLLQQQIKNLYQMLNESIPSQKFDGKQLDIQSRGLCLVPTSVMQKWTQLDQCCFAISNTCTINPIISRDV